MQYSARILLVLFAATLGISSLDAFSFLREFKPFDANECLKANFNIEIVHGSAPWGFNRNKLLIQKQECVMHISRSSYYFSKEKYTIDVCRAPVHIKEEGFSTQVYKFVPRCAQDSEDTFCKTRRRLFEVLQDDGLIFAEGQKEQLTSDHGKVFCAYSLITKYLNSGKIFNSYYDYSGMPIGHLSNETIPPQVGTTRLQAPVEYREEVISNSSSSTTPETSTVRPAADPAPAVNLQLQQKNESK